MIRKIKGTVEEVTDKLAIIATQSGLSYGVYCSPATLSSLSVSEKEVSLWTDLAVRENSHELYGFNTHEELSFFELLIGISGIGPKGAVGILSVADIKTLRTAIASGDTSYLTKVSGIGKKSADKIVLELRDKIGLIESDYTDTLKEDTEAIEALKSLGYTHIQARDALKEISEETSGVSERVREALKYLGS